MTIKPQKGPQEDFLATKADICVFGGAAGGGKTYALLMEPLRYIARIPGFGAVLFRRVSSQLVNEGGSWDTAHRLYNGFKPVFVSSPKHTIKFRNGNRITFSHMQHEKNKNDWDGSQIPLIMFDELQHFTENQFWYMLSRNRTTCGVNPYIRATCNPDPDSFLLELLEWWIDQETGDPIKERSGKIRYFIRENGKVIWSDDPEELKAKYKDSRPKSFTFIMSSLEDNPALMEADPEYKANIEALLDYEKRRLQGNWFARPQAGELFNREKVEYVESFKPTDIIRIIRYWDRASTEPNEKNPDPDYTAGCLMAEMAQGYKLILDIDRCRKAPSGVEYFIDKTLLSDPIGTVLGLEQEPGASGKFEVSYYLDKYKNHEVHVENKTTSKLVNWVPLSRAMAKGDVKVLKAPWNKAFFNELEGVTDGTQKGHDDQADAAAGAFKYLEENSGPALESIGGLW